jgi:hypothetical protein
VYPGGRRRAAVAVSAAVVATAETTIRCPYCQLPAERCTGADIYPHRPDLASLRFWRCQPCGAWVGCHKDSDSIPLGSLANAKTRDLRRKCHAGFDPVWRCRAMSRNGAYRRLAELMKIAPHECHISWFGERECLKALNAIGKLRREVGL